MIKKCFVCGKEFEAASHSAKFCSDTCRASLKQQKYFEKKEKSKAKEAIREYVKKESHFNSNIAEANEKGLTYGQMMAQKQSQLVRIERKPFKTKKEPEGRPKRKVNRRKTNKPAPAPKPKVIYEYRRIQFDECVEQWLYNEAHSNG